MGFRMEKEKTGSTPYILLDEDRGYMRFEGVSYHENVVAFFKEINEWLNSFLKMDFDSLTFDCALDYFNSSTAKLLLNMLLSMDECDNSHKIVVNWITIKENDIIIECGEDFQEELNHIQFNLVVN